MRNCRIVIWVVVGAAVLGMGLACLNASSTPGKPLSDSIASSLRGGCCLGMKQKSCPSNGTVCDTVTVLVPDSDSGKVTPSGDGTCQGATSCGHYYDLVSACAG